MNWREHKKLNRCTYRSALWAILGIVLSTNKSHHFVSLYNKLGSHKVSFAFHVQFILKKHCSFWEYTNERHIVLFSIKILIPMVYYSWLKCFPETVAECWWQWMNKGLLGADGHVSVVMDMALQALSSTLRLQEQPQHSLIFLAWFIKGHCVISAGMGFEFLSVKTCGLCIWWMFDCMRKFNWTCSVVVSIGYG